MISLNIEKTFWIYLQRQGFCLRSRGKSRTGNAGKRNWKRERLFRLAALAFFYQQKNTWLT